MARHYFKPRLHDQQIRVRPGAYTVGLQRLFLPRGDELEVPGSGGAPRGLLDHVTREKMAYTVGVSAAQGLQESVDGPGLRFGGSSGQNYYVIPVRGEARDAMTIFWHGIYHSLTGVVLRDATSSGGNIAIWRGSTGFDARVGGTDYTEAGTWTAGAPTSVLLSSSASAVLVYGNGDSVISGGAPGASAITSPWYLHRNGTAGEGGQITTLCLAIWNRGMSQQECEGFLADPYGALLMPRPVRRLAPAFTPAAAAAFTPRLALMGVG